MDSKGIIRKRLAQHRDIIEQILADEKLQDTIAQITDTIVTCFKSVSYTHLTLPTT